MTYCCRTCYSINSPPYVMTDDSRITYEQIAESLGLGKTAINTILHDQWVGSLHHIGSHHLTISRWRQGRMVQIYFEV